MPLFLESLTETENKEGEVPRKTHGIAGLRKRDMDTEQAKSTENHVVEMFPPEYEPKTQLTLRYQKDPTVPSSQGQGCQPGETPPCLQGTFSNTAEKCSWIWRGEAKDAAKHRTMLRTAPYKSSNSKCLQC